MTAGMNVPMIVFHNGSKSRNILPLQNKFSLPRTRSQSVRRQKKKPARKTDRLLTYVMRVVI
jgi:hypothetical protein